MRNTTIIPDALAIALDQVVAETGVERYRYLVSDDNRLPAPNSAQDYRRWILARGWRRTIPVDYNPVVGGAGCGGCGRG